LRRVRPDLPAWCTAIIGRALAKRPEDRFQTADEFRQTLSSVVVPQSLGELPTLVTPTPIGAMPPDGAARRESRAAGADRTPSPHERTTTVVLGPTHLAAIAALVLVLCAGILVLAYAAFQSRSAPVFEMAATAAPLADADGTQPEPAVDPDAVDPDAVDPDPVPAPAPAEPVTPAPPVASAARAADTSAPRQAAGTSTEAAAGTTGARPSPAVRAAAPAPVAPASDEPEPETTPAAPALPSVAFGNVRVVTTDGETARETRGMLRIGNGALAMGDSPEAARVLSSLGDVRAIFYSRSRQPRWRDAAGEEAGSRVDLGRLGFLRGDRNWLILLTDGDPVILSVEDGQLRQVSQAIEARTGRTVQRFQ
jgi:hypothetical protein